MMSAWFCGCVSPCVLSEVNSSHCISYSNSLCEDSSSALRMLLLLMPIWLPRRC
jgi:hypothetical protein